MPSRPKPPLASLAVLLAAAGGAYLAREPLVPLFLGMVAGAAAAIIGWRAYFFPDPPRNREASGTEREEWVRQVAGAMTDPMLLLDRGRIVVANPTAKILLGEWIEGQDVRLAMRHPSTVEALSSSSSADKPIEQVEIAGLGDPDRRWLLSVARLRDGSRLVHLSDRSAASAAERMRVDFVANASHELRTPLATILGFIETLQDDSTAADADIRARFLALMHGEAKRMQQLIEDLMSLSRIEADRFNAPREPVDLLPLVEEIRTGCAHLLAERNNRLVVEQETESTKVSGDRSQLLQLLRNLVVNAVKYGRADSAVTIRFEDENRQSLLMTVIDQGEGIPAGHLPRLTERFYRVDAGRSRSLGGTGLGLAIVKHIVSRHRGRLDIRSELGRGTVVAVALPRPEPAAVTEV